MRPSTQSTDLLPPTSGTTVPRSSSLDSMQSPPAPTPDFYDVDDGAGRFSPNENNRKSITFTDKHTDSRVFRTSQSAVSKASSTTSTMSRAESEALGSSISSVLITAHQITSPNNTSPTPTKSSSRAATKTFSPVKSIFTKSYITYAITVTSLSGESWTVWRRYSNFVELHECLPTPSDAEVASAASWETTNDLSWDYATNTPTSIPPLPQTPPRPTLPPKTFNTHIPSRQSHLNTYLHLLHLSPSIRSSAEFLGFIGADRLLLTPTTANLTSFPYAFRSQAGFISYKKEVVNEYFCSIL